MACEFTSRASVVLTSLLFLAMAFSAPASAQDCVPADITLTSQSEVDNFQASHGPCNRVVTDLGIEGADIFNLDGLSAITRVGGNVRIEGNAALTNVDGLSALTNVDGEGLRIANNDALTNVNGLSALTDVDGLQFTDNVALSNIDGLSALTNVSWLGIWNNNALTNVDGLSALTSVDDLYLDIKDNDALSNVDGLSALTNVGRLEIQNNDALTNVDGLSALTNVITLSISNNDALTSIDGLSALTNVVVLYLRFNNALTNVNGLSGLTAVEGLLIYGNPALDDCLGIVKLVDPIDDYEPGPDVSDLVMSENLPGCNSVTEILAAAPLMKINAGLNDAWSNPDTSGQGFFITVFPDIQYMFLAWFTFDTERPDESVSAILGEPGHRWVVAEGGYADNQAALDVYYAAGGLFDTPVSELERIVIGTMIVEFTTCNSGTVFYDIPSIDRQNVVPITRIALDNVALCYELNKQVESDTASESE